MRQFFHNFSWLRPGTHIFYGRFDSLEVSTSYILVYSLTVRCIPRNVLNQLLIFHSKFLQLLLMLFLTLTFEFVVLESLLIPYQDSLSFTRSNSSQLLHLSGLSTDSLLEAWLWRQIVFPIFMTSLSLSPLPVVVGWSFCFNFSSNWSTVKKQVFWCHRIMAYYLELSASIGIYSSTDFHHKEEEDSINFFWNCCIVIRYKFDLEVLNFHPNLEEF